MYTMNYPVIKNIKKVKDMIVETDSLCKNKTKIALSAQYFLSCPNNPEVIYVIISIKYHIGNDLDQDRKYCAARAIFVLFLQKLSVSTLYSVL